MHYERTEQKRDVKTVMQLAKGFDMSVIEFLDDEIFDREDLEIY